MKKILFIGLALLLFLAGLLTYQNSLAPTRVALVNYPDFLYSKIAGAAPEKHFKVEGFEQSELPKLKKYDFVLLFGMGLKLNAEQEAYVKQMGEKGVPTLLASSTIKGLDLTSVGEEEETRINAYLGNGGNKNYKNFFRYVRYHIEGKKRFSEAPDTVMPIASDVLFHIDEEVAFETVAEFEAYCLKEGIHKEGNKKVILYTSVPGPFNANREHMNELITELESRHMNVYPVSGFRGRLAYMQEIQPNLIVYMPHGRLSLGGGSAHAITAYLKELNVPVLCPVTVHQHVEEWLTDKQGMLGGLLSQSVTMPEFDGGIAPYALFAEYTDEKGHIIFKAVPNRLKKFGEMAENYVRLQDLENKDKKVAIVYFKGPGKNALVAADLEVLPSMHNMLLRLQKEGYDLGDLPQDYESFKKRVNAEGPVLGTYAKGAFDSYLATGHPELIPVEEYNTWCESTLPKQLILDVEERYGKAPGAFMNVHQEGRDYLAIARVRFGNITLVPQPMPGLGENTFALVHGAKVAPPHTYIAPYLWIQKGLQADALFHFGTHGSVEFTPGKQIALSDYDWTDPLIGSTPHNYIYTISNIGEAMIAKRRSYAALQSHLTPPFIAAQATQNIQMLVQKSDAWSQAKGAIKKEYALAVKELLVAEEMHKDLALNDTPGVPYTDEEMNRIAAYLAELENEKITAGLYTMGVPYSKEKLDETVKMLYVDALAYSLADLDVEKDEVSREQLRDVNFFRDAYLLQAEKYVQQVLQSGQSETVLKRCVGAGDLKRAEAFQQERAAAAKDLRSRMMAHHQAKAALAEKAGAKTTTQETGAKKKGGHPAWIPKVGKKPEQVGAETKTSTEAEEKPDAHSGATPVIKPADPKEEAFAAAVEGVKHTLASILVKRQELLESPEKEMQAVLNTLNGGYTAPSPGGDPIANPESVPSGRNIFSINAEQTPTKQAWKVAQQLTEDLFADFKGKHDGAYPKKISFTLWGGSFIESEGTTIAQILYMLGVEPIWTPRGKVNDIRLIPQEELGRPRIDVVVQTSGQLRDLAASRLFILNRAIQMAAEANEADNNVQKGMADAEKFLIEKGFSPKQAREMSASRIFGGVNGNYGTAIMGMVEQSDSWDSTKTVAETYINNMGAIYGNEEHWGDYSQGMFEAALLNTEAVVQPRQSNTWGALSLDHVYEFMGGLNLAIRHVTGTDADSYFNDFRNSSNARVQTLKEAIGVESRTTLLNARYIQELMKGGATSAEMFPEAMRNTFGWNVMKPSAIEDKLWNDLYDVYVQDKLNIQVQEFFERENPYALQEMTAIMLETVRKGMWEASPEQIQAMSELHAKLVSKHEAGCSGFVCDNAKLRSYIQEQLSPELKQSYTQEIDAVRESQAKPSEQNVVLKKEQKEILPEQASDSKLSANKLLLLGMGLLVLLGILIVIRKRRK